jgi:hypothetical protein
VHTDLHHDLGNAIRERVAFWLHELPSQEMIYHHVSLPVVFWRYIYGQFNGVSAGKTPFSGDTPM